MRNEEQLVTFVCVFPPASLSRSHRRETAPRENVGGSASCCLLDFKD